MNQPRAEELISCDMAAERKEALTCSFLKWNRAHESYIHIIVQPIKRQRDIDKKIRTKTTFKITDTHLAACPSRASPFGSWLSFRGPRAFARAVVEANLHPKTRAGKKWGHHLQRVQRGYRGAPSF